MVENPNWLRDMHPTLPPKIDDLPAQRIKEGSEVLARTMNASLYGDGARDPEIGLAKFIGHAGDHEVRNIRALTWREWFTMWRWRVHDAWLVLTGRADIE